MPIIESIRSLIHADFYLMNELGLEDEFVSHPEEVVLRQAWDMQAREAALNPDRRFVYITWLTEKKLRSRKELENPWEVLDFDRIEQYKEQLKDRIFVGSRYVDRFLVQQVITSGVITRSTSLIAMGEWGDDCVPKWGGHLRRSVGVMRGNFFTPAHLSRFTQEGKALADWHRGLRQVNG